LEKLVVEGILPGIEKYLPRVILKKYKFNDV